MALSSSSLALVGPDSGARLSTAILSGDYSFALCKTRDVELQDFGVRVEQLAYIRARPAEVAVHKLLNVGPAGGRQAEEEEVFVEPLGAGGVDDLLADERRAAVEDGAGSSLEQQECETLIRRQKKVAASKKSRFGPFFAAGLWPASQQKVSARENSSFQ